MNSEPYRRLIRTALVLFFFLASSQWNFVAAKTVEGQTVELFEEKIRSTKNFSIKIKGAYFQPSRTTFKDIYKNRLLGEGEFTVRVFKFIEL